MQIIPVAGVAAPLALFNADLAKLPVIGNAEKNEAAMLLIPSATSSCEASILYLFLRANALATAMLSMKEINGSRPMPEPNERMASFKGMVVFGDSLIDVRGFCKKNNFYQYCG